MHKAGFTLLVGLVWLCFDSARFEASANELFDSLPSNVQQQIIRHQCNWSSPAKVVQCKNEETQKYLAASLDSRFNSLPSNVQQQIIRHQCNWSSPAKVVQCKNEETQKYLAALALETSTKPQNDEPARIVEEHEALDSKIISAQKELRAEKQKRLEVEALAESERQRRIKVEQELANLKAQQVEQQQMVLVDTQIPLIDIVSSTTTGKQGLIKGYVVDNNGIAEVVVDGTPVPVTKSGRFEYRTFVPANGISVQVQATDLAGLTSVMSVSLERSASTATATITFDRLNPLGKQVSANLNALALIVGVADYENTPAKAIFADSDALMFRDYASEKLGIPENRIKTLVNEKADIADILLSVKNWLARMAKQEQSDIYIFFAGHGLTSEEPRKLYLFPYDGAPKLLKRTALLRDELFSEVAATKPRSVTVFLDTCYSGITRGDETLAPNRPIIIAPKESIPEGFTVMTAAGGDQTAKPLEEAKHGMFSYFLMKGMEGDADANQDNQITAGELHAYVQQNVIQQSSGSQTPELQGDADRVLVRFQ